MLSIKKLKEYWAPCLLMMMMMMMMMVNCFCGKVDRRKVFSLISSWDHCQRPSPLRISNTLRAGCKPAQNLSSGLVEWTCAVVITTKPWRWWYPLHHYTTTHYTFTCSLRTYPPHYHLPTPSQTNSILATFLSTLHATIS